MQMWMIFIRIVECLSSKKFGEEEIQMKTNQSDAGFVLFKAYV